MAVTKILKSLEGIRLRLIVPVGGARNHGLSIEQEPHITAQVNRGRGVNSSWKQHRPTATAAALFDGSIDGRGFIIPSVTACAEIAHVDSAELNVGISTAETRRAVAKIRRDSR